MLAIVPARGGSKGLPNKNIKELDGKPLIAYTIEAAQKAKGVDRVIVTTDSREIAEIASAFGAEIPFLRPAELARDDSLAKDVYLHAVDYLCHAEHTLIQNFLVLLPTAPLRRAKHIDEAIALFHEKEAETVISMTEAVTPVSWYYEMDCQGGIKNACFDRENSMKNRQVNKKYYIPNGAIYLLDYTLLKKKASYYSERTFAYLMNRAESVDIDTQEDFEYAEYLIQKRKMFLGRYK